MRRLRLAARQPIRWTGRRFDMGKRPEPAVGRFLSWFGLTGQHTVICGQTDVFSSDIVEICGDHIAVSA